MIDFLCIEQCQVCNVFLKWQEGAPATICAGCWDLLEIEIRVDQVGSGNHSLLVLSAIEYENPIITRMIRRFKYHDKPIHAFDLSLLLEALYRHATEMFGQAPHLVPVPLHWTRWFWRGYNQAELIAELVAKRTGAEFSPNLLARRKRTKAHHHLGREERASNVEEAFEVTSKQKQAPALTAIVDDVFTSGATLAACAKAFRQAGYENVIGLAVARAELERDKTGRDTLMLHTAKIETE